MLPRSQKLYIAFALKYIPGLIGPQIASAALSHSLWLPMLLSCTFLFASFPVLAALPETLPDKPSEATSATTADSLDTAGLRAYVTLITDYRIGVCMAIAFLTQFRYLNETILVAYVPVRYQWSISQVTKSTSRSHVRRADILADFETAVHSTCSQPDRLSFIANIDPKTPRPV